MYFWLKYLKNVCIVCAFNLKQKQKCFKTSDFEMSKLLRHRGPDWSGIYSCK